MSHDHNLTAASPNEATHGGSASVSNSGTGAELELQRSRDIKKNLIHCAELKKHNTRFYSEVLRKKFFVLYEDSRRSVTNPRDHTANTADSGAEPRPSKVRILYIGVVYNSVRPKPGFGIGNRNHDQVSVSVSGPELFLPKPKLSPMSKSTKNLVQL